MLPADAFYGNGPSIDPQVVIIDDSIAERLAVEKAWPSATCSSALYISFPTKKVDMAS